MVRCLGPGSLIWRMVANSSVMQDNEDRKRGAWFWIGTVLLTLGALFWMLLIWAVADDPEDTVDSIIGGMILTIIPMTIGIYAIHRDRKRRRAEAGTPTMAQAVVLFHSTVGVIRDTEGTRSAEVLDDVPPAGDHASEPLDAPPVDLVDVDGQVLGTVVAKHKVYSGGSWISWRRPAKTLYVTDRGLSIERELNVPYKSGVEISLTAPSGHCVLRYLDEHGRHKKFQFGPKHSLGSQAWGLRGDLYSDIVKASGYGIPQRLSKKLIEYAEDLRSIRVESDYIEPRGPWQLFDQGWYITLGGLKLRGTNVDSIKVAERGRIVSDGEDTSLEKDYDFDYIVKDKNSVDTTCYGNPKKRFLMTLPRS